MYHPILYILTLVASTYALPAPSDLSAVNSGNTYSGTGGSAAGGSVHGGAAGNGILPLVFGAKPDILNIGSNNAGHGGIADSGPSINSHHFGKGNTHTNEYMQSSSNSFSGSGGNTNGGSVDNPDGMINLWSNNAGGGGKANSGGSLTGLF